MKNTRLAIIWALIAAPVVLALWWAPRGPGVGAGEYPIKRTIRYSFVVKNESNRPLKTAQFWTYAPVKQTSTQRTKQIRASHPYRLEIDALGNQILYFEFTNLPPYASKIVRIAVELAVSDVPNRMPINDVEVFLQPERHVEVDAPEIRRVAETLRGGTPSETARNSYRWAADNVRYVGYIPDDRGALYALKRRKGDCTESMSLFTALARANGIPARRVGGYVVKESGVLRAEDYHNWAKFYHKNAWWTVDPQKKVFAENASYYVAMRVMGGASSKTMRNSHRFAYAGKGLTVVMN